MQERWQQCEWTCWSDRWAPSRRRTWCNFPLSFSVSTIKTEMTNLIFGFNQLKHFDSSSIQWTYGLLLPPLSTSTIAIFLNEVWSTLWFQFYSMDCYFRQYWRDNRLSFKGLKQTANNVIINQVVENNANTLESWLNVKPKNHRASRIPVKCASNNPFTTFSLIIKYNDFVYNSVQFVSCSAESECEDAGEDLEARHLLPQWLGLLPSHHYQVTYQ